MFLKVGLVLLGATIVLGDVLKMGIGGLIQALIMVASVFLFTWWLSGKAKLDDRLRAMSSAVAVCGVSAAIAAAGADHARREEVTYITTLVILTAIPLMVLMPNSGRRDGPQPAGGWRVVRRQY